MKVCFETFGCRLNKAEALQMEAEYAAKGWERTEKHSDADLFVLDPGDVDEMMRDILKEYKLGNPCLDISGLFVSRKQGLPGSKDLGLDFMTAIRGTKKDKNGQKMQTGEMHFGYPERNHGYFRHFKVVYSKPTDQMKVSKQ